MFLKIRWIRNRQIDLNLHYSNFEKEVHKSLAEFREYLVDNFSILTHCLRTHYQNQENNYLRRIHNLEVENDYLKKESKHLALSAVLIAQDKKISDDLNESQVINLKRRLQETKKEENAKRDQFYEDILRNLSNEKKELITSIKADHEEKDLAVQTLKAQVDDLLKKISVFEDENKNLMLSVKRLQDTNDVQLNEIQLLKIKNSELQGNCDVRDTKIKALKDKLNDKEALITELNKASLKHQEEMQSEKQLVFEMEEQLSAKKREVIDLSIELSNMSQRLIIAENKAHQLEEDYQKEFHQKENMMAAQQLSELQRLKSLIELDTTQKLKNMEEQCWNQLRAKEAEFEERIKILQISSNKEVLKGEDQIGLGGSDTTTVNKDASSQPKIENNQKVSSSQNIEDLSNAIKQLREALFDQGQPVFQESNPKNWESSFNIISQKLDNIQQLFENVTNQDDVSRKQQPKSYENESKVSYESGEKLIKPSPQQAQTKNQETINEESVSKEEGTVQVSKSEKNEKLIQEQIKVKTVLQQLETGSQDPEYQKQVTILKNAALEAYEQIGRLTKEKDEILGSLYILKEMADDKHRLLIQLEAEFKEFLINSRAPVVLDPANSNNVELQESFSRAQEEIKKLKYEKALLQKKVLAFVTDIRV